MNPMGMMTPEMLMQQQQQMMMMNFNPMMGMPMMPGFNSLSGLGAKDWQAVFQYQERAKK